MKPALASPCSGLAGALTPPGDKSISHRALMLGALCVGETRISGLLEGEDVLRTAHAVRALGAAVERDGPGAWRVQGCGIDSLREPEDILDMGNSGTGARLLLGILAAAPFTTLMTGDASLRSRPMERVMAPLRLFGATFAARAGGRLPLAVSGTTDLIPIAYRSPVASAQIKSAILLAGLHAPGWTEVIEPRSSRDHTELMLRHFGADITCIDQTDGSRLIRLNGQPELTGRDVRVPADPSSAAFPLVAALITPGSRVTVQNVGINPLRTGLFDTLRDMGADLVYDNLRTDAGEPVADITASHGPLKGLTVPAERAPSMIDEYPILAVAAAFAEGDTHLAGLGELRVKESDRLAVMADGLTACGLLVETGDDWMTLRPAGGRPAGGATIQSHLDHRIAMSFLVLGGAAGGPVTIDDLGPVATSFPDFVELMNGLGADIRADG